MKFFNKFKSKSDDALNDEEKAKLDRILNKDQSVDDKIEVDKSNIDLNNLEAFVERLKLDDIDNLRKLLDERERVLLKEYGIEGVPGNARPKYLGEENVEEKVTEETLNAETYEAKNVSEVSEIPEKKYTEEVVDVSEITSKEEIKVEKHEEDVVVEEEEEKEEVKVDPAINEVNDHNMDFKDMSDLELGDSGEEIYDELIEIFGSENVALNEDEHEKIMIGIRNYDAYENEENDDKMQNAWFVSNVKKLKDLKNFKIKTSSPTEKVLVWQRDGKPVEIHFKSTSVLSDANRFDF